MYWEYLPRKVIHKKGSKIVPSIKTGFEYKRSTLSLACSAYDDLLRPALILRRKKAYTLGCANRIKLFLQRSPNGQTNSETFIEWIKEILIPYIGNNECLFLVDSFEAHISSDIKQFLKKYSHIHMLIIPGGFTDILKPLGLV